VQTYPSSISEGHSKCPQNCMPQKGGSKK